MSNLLTASDIILILDSMGKWFNNSYSFLGILDPSESSTITKLAQNMQINILGSGTTLFPGISNQNAASLISSDLLKNSIQLRYDNVFSQRTRITMINLDNFITQNLPSGWNFGNSARSLDSWITRFNGNDSLSPSTPATISLSATNGGTIQSCDVNNAPYVAITHVSTVGDQYESLPTAAASQVALNGNNNAYRIGINSTTVPLGVAKVRVYRTYVGAGVTTNLYFYFDQDVPVVAGSAYPTITVVQSDIELRTDITPPSWLSCLIKPESAVLYALSYSAITNTGVANLSASGMMNKNNVIINPSNNFLGLQNQASSAIFAQKNLTGISTYTPQQVNNALNKTQGFAGSIGLQARVTHAVGSATTITSITYNYLDANSTKTGITSTKTGTFNLGIATGSTVDFSLPTDRLITGISTIVGGIIGTGGTFIIEGKVLRP